MARTPEYNNRDRLVTTIEKRVKDAFLKLVRQQNREAQKNLQRSVNASKLIQEFIVAYLRKNNVAI